MLDSGTDPEQFHPIVYSLMSVAAYRSHMAWASARMTGRPDGDTDTDTDGEGGAPGSRDGGDEGTATATATRDWRAGRHSGRPNADVGKSRCFTAVRQLG